ncbi:MAG: hypothetical protein ACK4Q5_02640 [Saprospiraceae bacterium]
MQTIINVLHSNNRYLLLAAILFALFRSVSGWLGKKPYEKADNAAAGALVGLAHLQLVLGLVQYFWASGIVATARAAGMGVAMKDAWMRYFLVEHITAMVLAVLLIQLGRTFSKKATDPTEKHKKVAIYTAIALLIIIGSLAPKGLLFSTVAAASAAN